MGLLSKIMDVFYDPEEEETVEEKEDIKKEEKPKIEEIHFNKPIIEEKKEEIESERDIFKPETKSFKFPIVEDEEKPKVRTRSFSTYEEERPIRRENKFDRFESRKEVKPERVERVFKPSPVISPVYGVLDKNYSKEEIVERKEAMNTRNENSKASDIDNVRRKAFGTLEDEIEDTLTNIQNVKEQEVKSLDKEIEELNKNSKSIEDLLSEIEINKNMSIGEVEEKIKDKLEEEEEEIMFSKDEETDEFKNTVLEDTQSFDKTLEHDLFNLIDSMYEDKEEE